MDAMKTLPKTLGLFQIKGDDGHGCYAGVEIVVAHVLHIPLFWINFFAQDEAHYHDIACDSIDWNAPEVAYKEYQKITHDFYIACLTKADGVPQLIWDSQLAYWWAMRFGDLRYELAR